MPKGSIPRSHPRYESLMVRERLVEGFNLGIVVPEGLIAHGRGEALDYILGEKTREPAERAARAAAAMLLLSKSPVISVNGNTAALAAKELVELAYATGAKLEVNLFHRSRERENRIRELLLSVGAEEVLGVGCDADEELRGLESARRFVSSKGIYSADTVLVALEDGDRTEALIRMGKNVIAIDLNPFSRTSRAATITIVDNVVRAVPNLIKKSRELSSVGKGELKDIVSSFDNEENLRSMIRLIGERLDSIAELGEW